AVLAPAAGAFGPAVADDGVPQAVGLGLIVGHDHEGHGLGLGEDRAAVQTHVAPAGQGELHHQFGAFGIGRIVGRAGDDAVDAAVGQAERDVELGRLLRLAQVVPDTGNDLVAHDAPSCGERFSATLANWSAAAPHP